MILATNPDALKFTTDTPPPVPGRVRESLLEQRLVSREEIRRAKVLRRQHGKYLPPRELVQDVRSLLVRAQQAMDTVRQSQVHRLGVLDRQRDRTALPAHEWEIAEALAQYSRAARELYASAPQSREGSEALQRRKERLARTLSSVDTRVTALEEYAVKAVEADDLYAALAERKAASANDHEDAVLDLTARSAADEVAMVDIASMDNVAAVVVKQLRTALNDGNDTQEGAR
ncbi:hypothetical protein [Streptomyces sp. NPDC088360]|uniref:hypothetical protein n=1 Tax=Streptomyces sp. NPDC088360 TaxID=3154515 RepID=UPI00344F297E